MVLPRTADEARTTPKEEGSRRRERGEASPPPSSENFKVRLSRSRKRCSVCMKRDTAWIIEHYTIEGLNMRYRACWEHMSDEERVKLEETYF